MSTCRAHMAIGRERRCDKPEAHRASEDAAERWHRYGDMEWFDRDHNGDDCGHLCTEHASQPKEGESV